MYVKCDRCGQDIKEGGMASIFGPGGAQHFHMGGCPEYTSESSVTRDTGILVDNVERTRVYKIKRPDGKFKGHGRGVWTKHGKTWSSLNDLKGHLRLSERYPEGCTVVIYTLKIENETSLESFR